MVYSAFLALQAGHYLNLKHKLFSWNQLTFEPLHKQYLQLYPLTLNQELPSQLMNVHEE